MRNHSNNEGTVAKCKFMSVCPFGLILFYCEDIIDCNMLQLKLVFRKKWHRIEKNDTKMAFLSMFKLILPYLRLKFLSLLNIYANHHKVFHAEIFLSTR